MHSDDIKNSIETLKNELLEIEIDIEKNLECNSYNDAKLRIIETRAKLLEVDAINELNWSFYYTKEELKNVNRSIQLTR